MPKHGKRYRALLEKVDPTRTYTIDEAAALVKELATAKFDETVEVHAKLGIDPRKSDQNVRGTVSLPHGLGKQVRVLAIAKGEKIKEAEEAGADYVGGEEIIQKILDGWMDFDAVVATPDVMGAVGSKLGRILVPAASFPTPRREPWGLTSGRSSGRSRRGVLSSATTRPGPSTPPWARPASLPRSSPTTSGPSFGPWRPANPRRPGAPSSARST